MIETEGHYETPEEANEVLSKGLDAIKALETIEETDKTPDRRETRKLFVRGMNTALYSGIVHFPHKVNAVEVVTRLKPHRSPEGMPDARLRTSPRFQLQRQLVSLLGLEGDDGSIDVINSLPEEVQMSYVLNLPYDHFTRPKKGDRGEPYFANHTLTVKPAEMQGDVSAYFEVQAGTGSIFDDLRIGFFLDEVSGIEFKEVDEGSFTPVSTEKRAHRFGFQLQDAPTSAENYLTFRGFHPGIRQNGGTKLVNLANQVRIPNYRAGNLTDYYISDETGKTFFTGFGVDASGDEPVLHHFEDYPIDYSLFGQRSSIFAEAILRERESPSGRVKTYTGRDIPRVLYDK